MNKTYAEAFKKKLSIKGNSLDCLGVLNQYVFDVYEPHVGTCT